MTSAASTTRSAASGPAPACRNCGEPMRPLAFTGHYGRPVEVDACGPCHLLWFDTLESSRLRGSSMIDLIRTMAAGHAAPHRPLRPDLRCLRCNGPVATVVNRSRFGRAEQLECRHGHGAWHSYGQWLAERGFVRPLTAADARAMALAGQVRHCFNCGGVAELGDTAACGWCGSAAVVMDVGRLLQAVDPDGATRPPSTAPPPSAARAGPATVESACHACGHTGAPADALRCPQCGATRIAGDLAVALAAVEAIEPALRAHEHRPAPHVRERRMAALQADLPRRREAAAELQRQADARRGGGRGEPVDVADTVEVIGILARIAAALWRWLGR